ncbi:hypothetical protein NDU88_000708 [Pleurodeles waltl]|uniref:Uncharacterized protein n=1 Tax=Pleurodeles waltl TaxID=8319 RepID=A0AAV7Q4Y8_PLEWA|nr:hypothetical protein NDU88_000708 [Pleurodeles waltl]
MRAEEAPHHARLIRCHQGIQEASDALPVTDRSLSDAGLIRRCAPTRWSGAQKSWAGATWAGGLRCWAGRRCGRAMWCCVRGGGGTCMRGRPRSEALLKC